MKTTTSSFVVLVVLVVLGAVGIVCGGLDRSRNQATRVDRRDSNGLLSTLSSRQRKFVKKELLHLLGLDHIPKPVLGRQRDETESSAPRYMLELYRNLQNQGYYDDDYAAPLHDNGDDVTRAMTSRLVEKQLELADTVTSFVNQVGEHRARSRHRLAIECRFDLSLVSPDDVLTGAVLRMYKSSLPRTPIQKLRIEVHRSLANDSELKRRSKLTLQQRVTILSNRNGWIDINVTPLVSEWMKLPTNNEGLYILLFNNRDEMLAPASVGIVGNSGPLDKQVFLVAFFKGNPNALVDPPQPPAPPPATLTRKKRSPGDNNGNTRNGRKQQQQQQQQQQQHDSDVMNDDHQIYKPYKPDRKCQLRTLKVSFRDLGWEDWIIAPEGYGAHYCDGDCVSPLYAHNATNHAIVQTMAYFMDPTGVPKPCCAPTKLAGLSVLYFDENSNVILKKYRGMVVKSCGCH